MYYIPSDYLSHHGIKGQKWGLRRFQNDDGSLTSAGKARYGGELSTNISGRINQTYQKTKASASRALGTDKKRERSEKWDLFAKTADKYNSAVRNEENAYAAAYYTSRAAEEDGVIDEEEQKKIDEAIANAKAQTENVHSSSDEREVAFEDFRRVQNEYYKTPLGVIEKAGEQISQGLGYVQKLFRRKK